MTDTIFGLSSGSPPAAIAVVRISGIDAGLALQRLAGRLPESRRATLATLRDPATGEPLDRALVLWFPGPAGATGEDLAELHLHGGRAVVAAVEGALAAMTGVRRAEAGEFTRRAFANGRLDLAEAEGLADLLGAETELQRRTALVAATGLLSRQFEEWRSSILTLGAVVEAVLDFSDEDDVAVLPANFHARCRAVADALTAWLHRPRAEPLREGLRVVLAGPPNSGKSTLFNVLTDSEAAITSPIPGTTRDLVTRAVAIEGIPFVFVDTAGLREEAGDPIEAVGMERARSAAGSADLVLWLGAEGQGAGLSLWQIAARCDCGDSPAKVAPRHRVSAVTGAGMDALRADLLDWARQALPVPGEAALGERQARWLELCREAVAGAGSESDPVLAAEHLRSARVALDRLLGRSGTEDMLDTLFARFCIGK